MVLIVCSTKLKVYALLMLLILKQSLKKTYEKKLSNVERAKTSTVATLKSEQAAAMAAKDEEVKAREKEAQEKVGTIEAMLR